ncbi:MAG: UvrD-helicase domain-containing protein, partial [Candidatus Competibacteraceae bacterium]|nr:UvrD-helicase domain-containing protein [Candidatus Competibacteraceae bacterium]
AQVRDLLIDNPNLNASKYRRASLPGWLDWLDELFKHSGPDVTVLLGEFNPRGPNRLEKFTSGYLAEGIKKGKTPPQHPFFDACQQLTDAFQELARCFERQGKAFKADLLEFLRAELARRKARLRVQSYDDLLLNLNTALKAEGGQVLAEGIRRRYSAALIDEFQDTDPIQYWNFRQIYGPSQAPVFLVGDPKQAIYSFRGADIFAYLEARRDADNLYTLAVNWRSQPGLIAGVNALFSNSPRPFLYRDIPFIPVRPALKPRQPLGVAGDNLAPLRLWLIGRREDHRPLAKEEAGELAARATAAEISRLLNLAARGRARLGDRPLEGGDIAVLVPTHRRGRQVRRQLLGLNIPSVQQSQEDVFQSREAQELERLLMAVVEPGRESLVRAALVTELLGTSGEALHRLTEDDLAWERRLEAFRDYHRLWREHGFIRAFRSLYGREDLARRLLGYRDGERRLTNLLHLAELLQAYAVQARAGMEGVVKWLAERRQVREVDNKAYELRLESDENLVKIVTIHKSKGLEYPVVFIPFPWDGGIQRAGRGSFAFHDPHRDNRAFLDLGSGQEQQHAPLARQEALAEGLR